MRYTVVVLLIIVAACSAQQELAPNATISQSAITPTLEPLESLAYETVADLPFPVQLTALPGSETSYIATKDGRIWLYDGVAISDEPVLDISDRVLDEGERGLLSIVCTRTALAGFSPTTPLLTVTPWFPNLRSSTRARLTRTRSVSFSD